MADNAKSGLIYSTDPQVMKMIQKGTAKSAITEAPPEHTTVRVELDRKRRRGKTVTLLTGFQASEEALKELAKKLKSACGAGGTTHDGEIEIQGDHRERVCGLLAGMGYKVKRIG